MKARIFYTTGVESAVNLKREGLFAQLYPLLDCSTIEPVRIAGDNVLLVDEEGLLRKREFNQNASMLAGFKIVGHAALLRAIDFYGSR